MQLFSSETIVRVSVQPVGAIGYCYLVPLASPLDDNIITYYEWKVNSQIAKRLTFFDDFFVQDDERPGGPARHRPRPPLVVVVRVELTWGTNPAV